MDKTVSIVIALLIAAILVASGFMVSSHASGGGDKGLGGVLCKDLKDDKAYEKYNLDHYKILIEGKDGWIFRTENDFRNSFDFNQQTIEYLREFQEALDHKGVDLIIVYPPPRGMIHGGKVKKEDLEKYMSDPDVAWQSYEKAIGDLQKAGINIVGLNREEAGDNFFYKRNHHWTADGARIMAMKTASLVKTLPRFDRVPRQKFKTIEKGSGSIESTFEKAVRKVCGTSLPDEPLIEYVTMQEYEAAVSEEELLGDNQQEPQVVLLGTSNSVDEASRANFAGFLKEYLSADVDNRAVGAAGIDTSAVAFLNSEKFRQGATEIVIWEIPGYYKLEIMDDKLFRQIIPAVYGPCKEPDKTARLAELTGGKHTLFDLTQDSSGMIKDPGDDGYYLHLRFSEPLERSFVLRFEYADNQQKRQVFSRDPNYPKRDGEYFIMFPKEDPENAELGKLARITAEFPGEMAQRDLEASVCRTPDVSTGNSGGSLSEPETGNGQNDIIWPDDQAQESMDL